MAVKIAKGLTKDYRSKILSWIQNPHQPQYNPNDKGCFRINFYSGTMPAMSSISYNLDVAPSMIENTWESDDYIWDLNAPVVSSSISSNPGNTLLAYIEPTFLNWSYDGDQLISTQQPQNLIYVADGTIGFYEFLFYGSPERLDAHSSTSNGRFYYQNQTPDTNAAPDYSPTMNNLYELVDPVTDEKIDQISPSSAGGTKNITYHNWRFHDEDYSKVHKFSAIYGSVGILSTGAELIVDRVDISSTSIPKMYEFGINPQLDVPPEPVV